MTASSARPQTVRTRTNSTATWCLTEGAKADSVPNLEIENGEIEAGHASATGRLDDEQLFYLMSRGKFLEHEARRLVVRGFFAELINQIGVPEVVERLVAAVRGPSWPKSRND